MAYVQACSADGSAKTGVMDYDEIVHTFKVRWVVDVG